MSHEISSASASHRLLSNELVSQPSVQSTTLLRYSREDSAARSPSIENLVSAPTGVVDVSPQRKRRKLWYLVRQFFKKARRAFKTKTNVSGPTAPPRVSGSETPVKKAENSSSSHAISRKTVPPEARDESPESVPSNDVEVQQARRVLSVAKVPRWLGQKDAGAKSVLSSFNRLFSAHPPSSPEVVSTSAREPPILSSSGRPPTSHSLPEFRETDLAQMGHPFNGSDHRSHSPIRIPVGEGDIDGARNSAV
ncbi:MAG: hypothetical protein M1814_002612 [Vezdaea aestivalis]|nr:MAG: hypothetical protein M1814_002612 [Vezdaea aestivalis]